MISDDQSSDPKQITYQITSTKFFNAIPVVPLSHLFMQLRTFAVRDRAGLVSSHYVQLFIAIAAETKFFLVWAEFDAAVVHDSGGSTAAVVAMVMRAHVDEERRCCHGCCKKKRLPRSPHARKKWKCI